MAFDFLAAAKAVESAAMGTATVPAPAPRKRQRRTVARDNTVYVETNVDKLARNTRNGVGRGLPLS